jgi:dolichol-phosphate mannosyltransferase
MTALVMIPTYNERENLEPLVRAVLSHPHCDLLVVDDGSPDGTGAVADALAAEFPGRVNVIHRTGPRGFGLSYLDAFRWALQSGADVICQMDADFSHDPKYLGPLIEAVATHDLALGSRYIPGAGVVNWPLWRRLLSAGANRYVRLVTGLRPYDCTGGFRCWRREALARVPVERISSEGYAFLVETLYEAARRGVTIAEVPIVFVERRQGRSKLSAAVAFEAMIMPWRLRLGRGRTGDSGPGRE